MSTTNLLNNIDVDALLATLRGVTAQLPSQPASPLPSPVPSASPSPPLAFPGPFFGTNFTFPGMVPPQMNHPAFLLPGSGYEPFDCNGECLFTISYLCDFGDNF